MTPSYSRATRTQSVFVDPSFSVLPRPNVVVISFDNSRSKTSRPKNHDKVTRFSIEIVNHHTYCEPMLCHNLPDLPPPYPPRNRFIPNHIRPKDQPTTLLLLPSKQSKSPQLQNPFFPFPASSIPSPTLLAPPSTPFPSASSASPTGLPALPVTPVTVCPTPRPAAPTTPPAVLATPETPLPKVEVTKPTGLLLLVVVELLFERGILFLVLMCGFLGFGVFEFLDDFFLSF